MNAEEILATAPERIERHRKADATVKVTGPDGAPLAGAEVRVEQLSHEFLFGCNIFPLFKYKDEEHETYGREFGRLLNYATLPFYWGGYEPEPGKKGAAHCERLARWCGEHGIATKGHPLVWHEVYPKWAPAEPDEARARLRERVTEIVGQFSGLIDRWDVVNEATVSHRFENGVGNWAKRDGAARLVGEALDWARGAGPNAILLYNDFNVSPDFEKLVAGLLAARKPMDAIGIQSHMHMAEWPLERAWQVCETYARFGKPLHFTELTVLSGRHKDQDDKDWHRVRTDWGSTPEGEARQADYVAKLYTLLFSHPAVEAITWWDFMDGGWQGAPAGLARKDLTPKPAYERLLELVKGKWWTQARATTDARGECAFRGFRGKYRVTVGSRALNFTLGRAAKVWPVSAG
jgi:GH35 family endo-1,4-beta-xylanase